jgi:hypothetical protein
VGLAEELAQDALVAAPVWKSLGRATNGQFSGAIFMDIGPRLGPACRYSQLNLRSGELGWANQIPVELRAAKVIADNIRSRLASYFFAGT